MNTSKIDWIIEIMANGVHCATCGKVENHYPDYICNAHTHGMGRYGHLDFQLVLYLHPNQMGYVLNNLGLRVQAGEQFKAGDWWKVSLIGARSDWMKLKRVAVRFFGSSFQTIRTGFRKIPNASIRIATSWCRRMT